MSLEFQQTIPFAISNSLNSESSIPDVEIKNPLDAKNFVNAIEFVPDSAFQLKGMLEVYINFLRVFKSPQVGYFKSYTRFSIPLSARALDNQGSIKIFAWNGLADSSPIACNGFVKISDKNIDLSSGSIVQTVPAGSDTLNIFPYVLRGIGTYTEQIDLSGYKKIALLIAAAAYVKPTNISKSGAVQVPDGLNNAIDGSLTTFCTPSGTASGGSGDIITDWGSVAIREPAVSMGGFITGSATITYFTSTDGVTYTAYVSGSVSMRYLKMHIVDANQPQVYSFKLFEIYDALTFGGQAEVSFEVLEPSSNQWITLISAGSIGAVSQGAAVAIQIGDTMVTANLNATLFSNYAGLRMKLTIISGNIQTAVSIQRLS